MHGLGVVLSQVAKKVTPMDLRLTTSSEGGAISVRGGGRPVSNDLAGQNVIFAEHGNVLVGMTSGYSAEQHRHSSRCPLQ
jgi:hypothetical protein